MGFDALVSDSLKEFGLFSTAVVRCSSFQSGLKKGAMVPVNVLFLESSKTLKLWKMMPSCRHEGIFYGLPVWND